MTKQKRFTNNGYNPSSSNTTCTSSVVNVLYLKPAHKKIN